MIKEVRIPQFGVNEETVKYIIWHKKDHEQVKYGELLCEVETDKAVWGIYAEDEGYLCQNPFLKESEISIQSLIAVLTDNLKSLDKNKIFTSKKKGKQIAKSDGFGTEPMPSEKSFSAPSNKLKDEETFFSPEARRLIKKHKIPEKAFSQIKYVKKQDVLEVISKGTRRRFGNIAIWGAGIGGINAAECAQLMGYTIKYFIDIKAYEGAKIGDVPVLKDIDEDLFIKEEVENIFVEIASAQLRRRFRCENPKFSFVTLIHPSAIVADSVKYGDNCFLKAGAVIDSNSIVGNDCIIDNGVIIPHNCVINDGVHLAPGVAMGGCVTVGKDSVIGVGAIIAPDLILGDNIIVEPGSCVTDNLSAGYVYGGCPAKKTGLVKKRH